MKLGKRYRQLIDEWVNEITRKYPQVKFEGIGRLPEDGAIAIRLRGPSDVLLEGASRICPTNSGRNYKTPLRHRFLVDF